MIYHQNFIRHSVDIVMCIDGSGSMSSTIDIVKKNAVAFYKDLVSGLDADRIQLYPLRIKVIVFRTFTSDKANALVQSCFFNLPNEETAFINFANEIKATGGSSDGPEDGLECLSIAIQSDWSKTNSKQLNLIVMWTDAATHKLEENIVINALNSTYPKDLPKNLNELQQLWNSAYPLNTSSKRLIVYAPNHRYAWDSIKTWKNVSLSPLTPTLNIQTIITDLTTELKIAHDSVSTEDSRFQFEVLRGNKKFYDKIISDVNNKAEISTAAHIATQRAFPTGKFLKVENIRLGKATGRFEVLLPQGGVEELTFSNERAFEGDVYFLINNQEKVYKSYYRWQCFNILRSGVGIGNNSVYFIADGTNSPIIPNFQPGFKELVKEGQGVLSQNAKSYLNRSATLGKTKVMINEIGNKVEIEADNGDVRITAKEESGKPNKVDSLKPLLDEHLARHQNTEVYLLANGNKIAIKWRNGLVKIYESLV